MPLVAGNLWHPCRRLSGLSGGRRDRRLGRHRGLDFLVRLIVLSPLLVLVLVRPVAHQLVQFKG